MNKYNKGITIVEILLSIIIIGIVLIILYNMLIGVRKDNDENQMKSQYVVNQANYVQLIEEDITNYGVSFVSACDLYDIDMDSFNINSSYRKNFKCIRINYAADYLEDNIGYLMVYNYNYKYDVTNNNSLVGKQSSWMIRYTRGHYNSSGKWVPLNSRMDSFPDDTNLEESVKVKFNRSNSSLQNLDAAYISVPIISSTGEHYDINLPFLINSDKSFYCYTGISSGASYAKLECSCTGYCDNLIKNNMYSIKS
ncbi:MAG: prepilin-type N-terminal cleavage/methylation domain-containing protein [Bacilli bacterium]|nr:prepilin-type N-terminal cleavage/methylation domain-containing protein [Bacilli bacterium]